MKKLMLVAAMLAMVLAAAVPALAQSVTQVGNGNVACVQTAINTEAGKDQTAVANGQYGNATNINIQAIAQSCNVTPAQVSSVVANAAPAAAQYPAGAQYQYASPSASASVSASPSASASASAAAQLPSTGGASLIALGAGVLLVAGGLLARRIVR